MTGSPGSPCPWKVGDVARYGLHKRRVRVVEVGIACGASTHVVVEPVRRDGNRDRRFAVGTATLASMLVREA